MVGSLPADTTHWNLRGSVRSMRSETAERDLVRSDWEAARPCNFLVFDESGRLLQLDQRGAENSVFRTTFTYDPSGRLLEQHAGTAGTPLQFVTTHRYDDQGRPIAVTHRGEDGRDTTQETSTYDDGRRTRVQIIAEQLLAGNVGFGVDGSEFAYGAPGARTITTRYDDENRPVETVFHDITGMVVLQVIRTRDRAGRVLTEEAFQNASVLAPHQPEMSQQEREVMIAMLAQVYGSIRTTNEYDADGRLVQRTQAMGALGGTVTTYIHNEHGDVAEQSQVSTNREMRVGEDGQTEATPDVTRTHDTRFSYEYDESGNWTSRVVSARITADGVFAPSTIERRTIEYYEG
jgi:YD repeat-containing protein